MDEGTLLGLIFIGIVVAVFIFKSKQGDKKHKKWCDAMTKHLEDSMGSEIITPSKARDYGIEEFNKGDYDKSSKLLSYAIEKGLGDDLYHYRAECYKELGRNADALTDYGSAIHLEPNDCNLFFMRSLVLQAMGAHEESIQDLIKAIKLSKEDTAMNEEYHQRAVANGHSNGHTAMYQQYLMIAEMGAKNAQRVYERKTGVGK